MTLNDVETCGTLVAQLYSTPVLAITKVALRQAWYATRAVAATADLVYAKAPVSNVKVIKTTFRNIPSFVYHRDQNSLS